MTSLLSCRGGPAAPPRPPSSSSPAPTRVPWQEGLARERVKFNLSRFLLSMALSLQERRLWADCGAHYAACVANGL